MIQVECNEKKYGGVIINSNDGIMLKETIEYSEKLRKLIKSHNYEKYIQLVLNRSVFFFKDNNFSSISNQSNGEADFLDAAERKYDVKLVITTEQGALIGDRKNDLLLGIDSLNSVSDEYASIVNSGDFSLIKDTTIYKAMKKCMESIEEDEVAILFLPFLAVMDNRHSIYGQFGLDYIQAVYDQLLADGLIKNDIYFIYPSTDKDIYVLRDGDYHREYIEVPELSEFISFVVTL